ncbi:Bro-N domain-containing protein [Tissierella carlieri]|uniref:BRO-N domain-containing protein n=1 Tax=Tissierella carlieri TaxID=689904 RepID=UPI001FE655B9|nr:Bro-N domain-containing protein [Tissierella carlieri]
MGQSATIDRGIKNYELKLRKVDLNKSRLENETWYFSIVDVISILTDSNEPRRYWSDLKIKLKNEGNELYDKIVQLKMTASDGKKRMTDVADTEELLRIIQSIPSPKAESFKMWLARVGSERIDETIDPELTINRALETYLKKE